MEAAELETFPAALRDRFEPQRLLGRGGMGAVYEAQDRRLARRVAIKVVKLAGDPGQGRRLLREAEVLAGLKHRNLVHLYESGEAGGEPFLVMELIPGRSMLLGIPGGRAPAELMLELADGLDEAHRAGILHRDLKPANVLATEGRGLVLVDFGLALAAGRTRLTAEGGVLGTLATLAPEIWEGEPYSARSDWYAWGCTAYYACARELPFDATAARARGRGGGGPLRWPPAIPAGPWRDLLAACLAVDPRQRPGSAAELRDHLAARPAPAPAPERAATEVLAPPTPPAAGGPPRFALPGAVALVAAAVALGLPARHPAGPGPAQGPRFAGLAPRALASLEEAVGRTWRPEGSAEERPVLDPDPLGWDRALAAVPEVLEFEDWVLGGGRPEELAPEVGRQLREVDAAFGRRRLAGPFGAYLVGEAGADPARRGALAREAMDRAWRTATEGEGEIAGQLVRWAASPDEALRTAALPFTAFARPTPVGSLEFLLPLPATRRALAPILVHTSTGFRGALLLAGRALAADPEGNRRVALTSGLTLMGSWRQLLPGFLHGSPDLWLGGAPASTPARFLRLCAGEAAVRLRDLLHLDSEPPRRRIEEDARALLAGPLDLPLEAAFGLHSAALLVTRLRGERRLDELLELQRTLVPRLEPLAVRDPDPAGAMAALVTALADTGEAGLPTPLLDALAPHLAGYAAVAGKFDRPTFERAKGRAGAGRPGPPPGP